MNVMIQGLLLGVLAATIGLTLAGWNTSPILFGIVGLFVAFEAKSEMRKRNELIHKQWKAPIDTDESSNG